MAELFIDPGGSVFSPHLTNESWIFASLQFQMKKNLGKTEEKNILPKKIKSS